MKRALRLAGAAIDTLAARGTVASCAPGRTALRTLGISAMVFGLAACANEQTSQGSTVNDPLEPFNRYMLAINQGVDTVVLRPVAVAYRDLVPYPVQDAVHNFLTNLTEPVTLLNQLLQGQVNEAGHTVGRFMANSVLGLGGTIVIVDIDDQPGEREDFGQTLGSWGVDEGFYLVLPIIGPSNARDTVGLIVDFFTDPFNIWAVTTNNDGANLIRSGLTIVDTRVRTISAVDALEADSLDFYARLRSAYTQQRNAQIENRASGDTPFGAEPFDEVDEAAGDDSDNPFGDEPFDEEDAASVDGDSQ
ncbi:MAG: VacJ family lipoprotein [Alphaproteobacteria bacterium]